MNFVFFQFYLERAISFYLSQMLSSPPCYLPFLTIATEFETFYHFFRINANDIHDDVDDDDDDDANNDDNADDNDDGNIDSDYHDDQIGGDQLAIS